ncbi:MAG: hypothetical protein V7L04_04170 [Nostoc sp.]|uniref:hypothetical protein n=1 Tax=Nostoc sp. TaxID=1180 RepID=UPI002FF6083A
MASLIDTQRKDTKKQLTGVANSSAQGMLQSRPFVMQSKNENQIQQHDLKTSLMQAERYGHHLDKIQPAGILADTAVQTKLGTKQLPKSNTAELPQAQDGIIQGVWVNYKNGKVGYDWGKDNKDSNRPSDNHVWMDDKEFVTFKNAGKRRPSNKWTDKTTGVNYYSDDGQNFFTDKEKKGKPVTFKDTSNLLDRRRSDRHGQKDPISLYDVTTYKDAKNREKTGDAMEHDHVTAGESMKHRVDKENNDSFEITDSKRKHSFKGNGIEKGKKWAYDNAPSIEIRGKDHPEGNDHQDYTPTWGKGRQYNEDTAIDNNQTSLKRKRPDMDAELPGVAFERDTDTMLNETHKLGRGKDDSLKQLGAYRYLYRRQIKLDNISPDSPAYKMTKGNPLANKNENGGVEYTYQPGKTQGQLLDSMFLQHSQKRLSTPLGIKNPP